MVCHRVSTWCRHCVCNQEDERGQEVGLGFKESRPAPNGSLPLASLHLSRLQSSQLFTMWGPSVQTYEPPEDTSHSALQSLQADLETSQGDPQADKCLFVFPTGDLTGIYYNMEEYISSRVKENMEIKISNK